MLIRLRMNIIQYQLSYVGQLMTTTFDTKIFM